MREKNLKIFLFIILLIIPFLNINALEFSGQGISSEPLKCGELLGTNLLKIVKLVMNLLRIGGALIAIVNGMLVLIPAVVSKDADALKKAENKLIILAIVLLLILLLPTLLSFIGNLFGYDMTCIV